MKKVSVLLLMIVLNMQVIGFNNYEGLIKTGTIPLENQILSKDKVIIKCRYYCGKRQYRRWNDTKKRWIDPNWIDM